MAGVNIRFNNNAILNLFGYLCFLNLKGWGASGLEVCIDQHNNIGTCDEGWECCEHNTKCCLENWPIYTITGIVIASLVGLVLVVSCCAVVVYSLCNKNTRPRRIVYPDGSPGIHTIDGHLRDDRRDVGHLRGPYLFSAQGPPAYQMEPPPYSEHAASHSNDTNLAQVPPTSHKLTPWSNYTEPPPYTESTH